MAGRRWNSLQGLRAVAALAIVLYHLMLAERLYGAGPCVLPGLLRYGACGVDLFFVLSGFVLVSTYAERFGKVRAVGPYLLRRALRIYPLYWIFSGILLLLIFLRPDLMDRAVWEDVGLVRSFLLLPQHAPPLLSVGWALIHLMYFYVVFALLLGLPRRRLSAALCLWAAFVVVGHTVGRQAGILRTRPALSLILNPLTLEFIAGCALAQVIAKPQRPSGRTALWSGAVLLVGGIALHLAGGASTVPKEWVRVAMFGIPACCFVYGLAASEHAHPKRPPRLLMSIGNASYPLYLSHTLVISVVGHFWRQSAPSRMLAHMVWVAVAVAAAIVAALAANRMLERPLARVAKRLTTDAG